MPYQEVRKRANPLLVLEDMLSYNLFLPRQMMCNVANNLELPEYIVAFGVVDFTHSGTLLIHSVVFFYIVIFFIDFRLTLEPV